MTDIQKLTAELNEMNQKRLASKESAPVSDFPVLNRSFIYRKSPAIKASDVGSL